MIIDAFSQILKLVINILNGQKGMLKMRNFVRAISTLLILTLCVICVVVGYYSYYLPDSYYVTKGTSLKLCCKIDIKATNNNLVLPSQNTNETPLNAKTTLKLFGVIPIKEVKVNSVDTPVLVPGGNPFGIKILMEGVMVIGTSEVDTCDGDICPATESGINIGDLICEIDGNKITSNQNIAVV